MGPHTLLSPPPTAAPPAMTDDSQLTFSLPTVSRKKVTAAFNGGRLSSDAGVMLLALAERRRQVADTLAAHIADRRDRSHITHTVADVLLHARMLVRSVGLPLRQRRNFREQECASALHASKSRYHCLVSADG